MDVFPEILKTPWVQIVGWTLGAMGWIIGIVSGLIQLRSYYEQKRLEKGYVSILEQAKRDWEARYTEEQVNDLTQELTRLQEAIRRDVPQQAKQVFLKEQLQDISGDIGRLYSRYAQLSQGLSEQSASEILPSLLREAIEETIMPDYLAGRRQQRAIYGLLVALVALTLLSTLLPLWWEIAVWGSRFLRLVALAPIVLIMGYTLHILVGERIAAWARRPSPFRLSLIVISWIASLFCLDVFLTMRIWTDPAMWEVAVKMLSAVLALSSSLLLSYYAVEDKLLTFLRRLKRNS